MDLAAIRHNVAVVLSRVPPGTRLFAVVKADGYGHGAEPVARAALAGGAHGLAVSTLAEARALSGVCPPDRVLALGGLAPGAAAEAAATGTAVVCSSMELAAALSRAADPRHPLPVHLKIDTGMGRLGCRPEEAPQLAAFIVGAPGLRLAGTMTHFACADSDEEFTRAQFRLFQEALAALGVEPGLRHAGNSASALRFPEMALDAVRVGIALYGCAGYSLRPALSLHGRITHVRTVDQGAAVGYGATWRALARARIATVAMGYADGVHRARGNRGWALVRGRRAPLVGAVSMDAVTLDVTGIAEAVPGDVATLIGSSGSESIDAGQVASWSGTIAYEVLTSIGARVARVHLGAEDRE
ncbi:MAG: alanine racemase [Candidatus Dormibacteraceae bacterium]